VARRPITSSGGAVVLWDEEAHEQILVINGVCVARASPIPVPPGEARLTCLPGAPADLLDAALDASTEAYDRLLDLAINLPEGSLSRED